MVNGNNNVNLVKQMSINNNRELFKYLVKLAVDTAIKLFAGVLLVMAVVGIIGVIYNVIKDVLA